MASLFKTVTDNAKRAVNLVGTTCESVEKTLDLANHYVDKQTKGQKLKITDNVRLSVAEHRLEVKARLDEDEDLRALFQELESEI